VKKIKSAAAFKKTQLSDFLVLNAMNIKTFVILREGMAGK
jgi:hypothetical protein